MLTILFFSLTAVKLTIGMRLDTPEFRAVLTPELKSLAKIFEKYGFKDDLRIVGGSVRDLLAGITPADIDLATTATPEEMKEMFTKENIRMFGNGEVHGTISVRINRKESYEITTLRDDIITDGRHATVLFTKDWIVDAARRDLTINSMYLDLHGNLHDYFNGYEDLKNNRVVFVGDPNKRIKEDYLRILRYFRFFGRVSRNPNNHDEKTMQAIRDNASGLGKISGERIWSELQKILTGNYANEIVKKMLELGLASYIGLNNPDDLDWSFFDSVCNIRDKYSLKATSIIAALLKTKNEVRTFNMRVKWPAFDRDLALFLVDHKKVKLPDFDEECFKYFQHSLMTSKTHEGIMRTFIIEYLKFVDREAVMNNFEKWTIPAFPIDGHVIKDKGFSGRHIGLIMQKLKEKWFDNNFVLTDDMFASVVDKYKTENKC